MKIRTVYNKALNLGLKSCLISLMGLLCLSAVSQTRGVELSQTITKNFTFNRNQILEIKNKYGKIHVNSWDKSQASIKIVITSKANNRDNAQRRLDEVEIRERTFGQKIQLETIIPDNIVARVMTDRGVKVSYEIYMPKYGLLEIENKYGDVYLSERDANVDIEISYGKLIANRLAGQNNALKLSFGDSDIAYIGGGDIGCSFVQRLYIGEAKTLNLKTNSTSVNIGQVDKLTFNGNLGKMEIDEADLVSGNFSSTLFSIAKLNKSLNMVIKYAPSFQIHQIAADFTSIRIESSLSPIQLRFHEKATFLLDAQMEFGSISKNATRQSNLTESKEGNFNISKGKIGSGNKPNSKVYIRGKYGSLKISQ